MLWRGSKVLSQWTEVPAKPFCLPCDVSQTLTMSQSTSLGLVGSPMAAATAKELDAGPEQQARFAIAEGGRTFRHVPRMGPPGLKPGGL